MSYLKQFEYVLAIAECGGISQASERLGVSQPTFSKYLKKIEGELGVELVDRSTLPIRLTKAGEAFLAAGRRFLDLDRQLAKQLDEIKGSGSVVRVGISPSRSPYVMPDVVAEFYSTCPNARIVIEERTTAELNERLRTGELDLLISLLDADTESFCKKELFDEEILLAVPTGLLRDGDGAKDVIGRVPLISVGRTQALWQVVEGIWDRLGAGVPKVECQSIESGMALVKRGVGAMLVPSYIAGKCGESVKFLSLGKGAFGVPCRKVCLFYRAEQYLSQAERQFAECVGRVCGTKRG